jgi:diaminohydroxyphosphoribosylaminopyrimidine deaminase / 5-amino-6-(5-phosphoribosylamino)uracil reductase
MRATETADIDTQLTEDRRWMARALQLARLARGRAAPNPAVGSVLVRDGGIVGEGHTQPPGSHHAEIVALERAGDLARGATLYVTLEPCCHFGRTPPCLDAILDAGVARVVIAIQDPYPLVNGRSIRELREHGVVVVVGPGEDEAREINAGFFKRIRTGLPEVHVKYAMSLDGKIATRTGHSRWITGDEARLDAHRIRDVSDAILVGIGTVLADDPRLTTRLPDSECGAGGPHHPTRVVVDSTGRMPVDAAMLSPDLPGRTLIATTGRAPEDALERLRQAGAEVVVLPDEDGAVDLAALLRLLGARGVNSLMAEGGSRIIGTLFDRRLVDRVTAYVAPVILGGIGAPAPVGGLGAEQVAGGALLESVSVRSVGRDVRISGRVAICRDEEG